MSNVFTNHVVSMRRHQLPRVARFAGALVVVLIVLCSVGCETTLKSHDVNDSLETQFFAVENGRMLTLKNVQIRERGSKWTPWHNIFVEEVDAGSTFPNSKLPKWNNSQVNQKTLDWMYRSWPGYRSRHGLMTKGSDVLQSASKQVTATRAWIVGTWPLTLAVSEKPQLPKSRADIVVEKDGRAVDVAEWETALRSDPPVWLVTTAEIEYAQAELVLICSPDVFIATDHTLRTQSSKGKGTAMLYRLNKQESLPDIMRRLTNADSFKSAAEKGEVTLVGEISLINVSR